MPVINLRIDQQTRELWVEAANGENVTLSEWIRRACDQRLGLADKYVDMPYQPPLDIDSRPQEDALADDEITIQDIQEAQQFLAQTAGANQVGAGEPSLTEPQATASPVPAPAPTTPPHREFKPDFKPEAKPKKRR